MAPMLPGTIMRRLTIRHVHNYVQRAFSSETHGLYRLMPMLAIGVLSYNSISMIITLLKYSDRLKRI